MLYAFEPCHEKMCLREFPTWPDTNRPAQPQKLARVLKFRLQNLEILYHLSSGCAGWSAPLLFAYDMTHFLMARLIWKCTDKTIFKDFLFCFVDDKLTKNCFSFVIQWCYKLQGVYIIILDVFPQTGEDKHCGTQILFNVFSILSAFFGHIYSMIQSHCLNFRDKNLCPNEPRHDKTNKVSVRPAKTQISLGIRPVWSESSLCAQWEAKDPRFLHADSEDSDQTGRMPRLIWVFAGRTLTSLVLSCCGSNVSDLAVHITVG